MDKLATARRVAVHYVSEGRILGVEPLGDGLINSTLLVRTESKKLPSYVLQRINRQVFPQPEQIMQNLQTLIRHARQRQGANRAPVLRIPVIHQTLDGMQHVTDSEGGIWRALEFIDNTLTLKTIRGTQDAEEVGFALGSFHRLLSGLDPSLLHVTLPGFHNTPGYLANYKRVLAQSNIGERSSEEGACAKFIYGRAARAGILENAKNEGLLMVRPIHGDPKMDNILFDEHTGRAVSIIDLDTVMPGLVHYDIGDCLRSSCNTAGESPASDTEVDFDMVVCAAILRAYLDEARCFLTPNDYAYLYDAIWLIPFELGLRFFTDYLEGNKYFRSITPDETLRRAETQFKLSESIEQKQTQIKKLICDLINELAR